MGGAVATRTEETTEVWRQRHRRRNRAGHLRLDVLPNSCRGARRASTSPIKGRKVDPWTMGSHHRSTWSHCAPRSRGDLMLFRKVRDRDTLPALAARFDTTPSELTKLNRLATHTRLSCLQRHNYE
ncbi:unnamed protein product [Leptidea sinapis]|uniref:LysM domain-containing protein n=1 Tax=Leptidea sinapis TaxID=189913 RepID=A0A5E4PRH6_9NEOP|nr:unnamed protein product [Leptidea sinapis]